MKVTGYEQVNIVLMMMTLFLGLCIIGTIIMIVILAIKGDERNRMLISKSAIVSVIGAVVALVLGFVYSTFIGPYANFEIELNPIMYLGVISIIFDLAYFYYRRKYGN